MRAWTGTATGTSRGNHHPEGEDQCRQIGALSRNEGSFAGMPPLRWGLPCVVVGSEPTGRVFQTRAMGIAFNLPSAERFAHRSFKTT
jgi:hypothetical protein